jgi:hypothetical protein
LRLFDTGAEFGVAREAVQGKLQQLENLYLQGSEKLAKLV